MMRCFKFTTGLIAGMAIGLLTAPAKGEETRKKLSDTANAWKNRIDDLFGRGNQELDDLKTMLEDPATEFTEDLRRDLLRLIERTKKAFKEAHKESLS